MAFTNSQKTSIDLSPELALLFEEHRTVESTVVLLEEWLEQLIAGETAPDHFFGVIEEVELQFNKELFYHLDREEQCLFPLLGKYMGTDSGVLYIMCQEREVLRNNYSLMLELWQEGRRGPLTERDLSQLKWACKDFLQILKSHIQKEDEVLFPMANKLLSLEEKQQLKRELEQLITK